MPTKLNKAGQQQNYVPAGNGDASGEYGDNATGSNIHFTAFKKPDDEKPIDIQNQESKKVEEQNKNVKDNIINTFKKSDYYKNSEEENVSNFVDNVIADNDEEKMNILNNMISENDRLRIRFGGAGGNAGCASGYSSVSLAGKSVHTFNHELGHIWDAFYGRDMNSNGDKYPLSHRIVTRWIDNSEKKSFDEVLHEELGINGYDTVLNGWKIAYKKRGVDKKENKIKNATRVTDIFNELCDNILDEETGIKNAYNVRKELKEKKNNAWSISMQDAENDAEVKNAYEIYTQTRQEVEKIEQEYADNLRKKGIYNIYYSNSNEVMNAREKKQKAWDSYMKIRDAKANSYFKEKGLTDKEQQDLDKIDKNFYQIFKKTDGLAGIVGDMSDYMGVSRARYTTNGHGSYYFNQRKDDGFSSEIWANMFDCYIDKDQRQYEALKKMFPRGTKLFEEALAKFGKGNK